MTGLPTMTKIRSKICFMHRSIPCKNLLPGPAGNRNAYPITFGIILNSFFHNRRQPGSKVKKSGRRRFGQKGRKTVKNITNTRNLISSTISVEKHGTIIMFWTFPNQIPTYSREAGPGSIPGKNCYLNSQPASDLAKNDEMPEGHRKESKQARR